MSNWQQMMPSPRAYKADKVLYDLHHKTDHLQRYKSDPGAYLDKFGLDDALKTLLLNDEIGQLFLIGVNPYLLRAHCVGMRIPEAVSVASLAAVAKDMPHG